MDANAVYSFMIALLIVVVLGAIGMLASLLGGEPVTDWRSDLDIRAEAGNAVARHPVHINRPDGPPRTDTGLRDAGGYPITARCATCHNTHEQPVDRPGGDRPTQFHHYHHLVHANDLSCADCHDSGEGGSALRLTDGSLIDFSNIRRLCVECHTGQHPHLTHADDLSCLSCHNPEDYSKLRLADGSPVDFADVQRLCAQCHGLQHRDYLVGLHGGMTGYWDLTRGERHRLNCIDCHDAHAPQFPTMQPAPGPRDTPGRRPEN